MKKHNVPALYGLDTRSLTKRIRQHGAVLGKIELSSQVRAVRDESKTHILASLRLGTTRSFVGFVPVFDFSWTGLEKNTLSLSLSLSSSLCFS